MMSLNRGIKSLGKILRRNVRFKLDFHKKLYSTENSKVFLGIETSCDDTGCALVNLQGKLLGECLISQQDMHTRLGGIIPPLARDMHSQNIDKVVKEALSSAGMKINDVHAIAVTVKPGLPMSLEVGVKCAKSLSASSGKPLIPIHHMEAHALTVRMIEKVEFPFLVLLISGGHCLLAVAEAVNKFLLLGKSLDDAPGEAFDKIARRLKIWNLEGYDGLSGGRAMEMLAEKGDPTAFDVSEPLLHSLDCNFSFAGVKNSSRLIILEEEEKHGIEGGDVLPNLPDICASIHVAITKHLCRRLQRAMIFSRDHAIIPPSRQNLVVSGGVAANGFIRKGILELCQEMGYCAYFPPPKLCTDNGVMIAWNGAEKWRGGIDIVPPSQLHTVDFQGKAPFGVDMTQKLAGLSIKCQWAKSVFSQKAFYASKSKI